MENKLSFSIKNKSILNLYSPLFILLSIIGSFILFHSIIKLIIVYKNLYLMFPLLNFLLMILIFHMLFKRTLTEYSDKNMYSYVKLIQEKFIENDDPNVLFESVMQILKTLTDSKMGYIGILLEDEQGKYLKTYYISNISWNKETKELYDKMSPNLIFRNFNNLFGHSVLSGEIVISNNPKEDHRGKGFPPGHPTLSSYIGISLFDRDDKPIGLLGLANRKVGYDMDVITNISPILNSIESIMRYYKDKHFKEQIILDLKTSNELQVVLAKLTEFSIDSFPLNVQLINILETILTLSFVSDQFKGAILLTNKDGNLELACEVGLNSYIKEHCKIVMAGECLCGKSLARKELIYSGCVDSDHDIQFDGMPQHGHYCVPLILEDEVLGILTVYLKHGHKENEKEKEWLRMIAATIAKSLHCKGVNEKFKFCATHDQLTSLPNKLLLFDRLTQMMLNADRYQTKLVILFMDLNKFKKVNDILGHKAGDEVLVQAAERLLSVSRKSDTVSRVGGDEFIIACSMNDISGLQQICNTIKSSIKHPMILNNGSIVNIDISIGASIYPDHGNSLEKLIKIADECMYISKKEKLNYWLFSL